MGQIFEARYFGWFSFKFLREAIPRPPPPPIPLRSTISALNIQIYIKVVTMIATYLFSSECRTAHAPTSVRQLEGKCHQAILSPATVRCLTKWSRRNQTTTIITIIIVIIIITIKEYSTVFFTKAALHLPYKEKQDLKLLITEGLCNRLCHAWGLECELTAVSSLQVNQELEIPPTRILQAELSKEYE